MVPTVTARSRTLAADLVIAPTGPSVPATTVPPLAAVPRGVLRRRGPRVVVGTAHVIRDGSVRAGRTAAVTTGGPGRRPGAGGRRTAQEVPGTVMRAAGGAPPIDPPTMVPAAERAPDRTVVAAQPGPAGRAIG